MGSSPSADVYYGYDLGDMTDHDTYDSLAPSWWEDSGDWEDELARRLGWEKVSFPDDYPEWDSLTSREDRIRIMDEYKASSVAYQAYAASRDRKVELLASIPVEIRWYGYREESCYAIRAKASVQRAFDWGSVPLKPLEVDPAWAGQIARFVELLELTVPEGGPAWHLNCSYG
ncbi:hypothetical protein [Nocardia asiatica]|uniref:hypothetical protein n=1 Tax=Nocardia asiatica TaxID=209252 RepID=UPI0024588905|nr:hypothetical protein [Nocardia asiatica]